MSSNASASASGGIGFFGLLQVVFITLKLTGHLTWSWLWVFSPLWIGFSLWLLLVSALFGLFVYVEKNR
jgi:hypothetical protein